MKMLALAVLFLYSGMNFHSKTGYLLHMQISHSFKAGFLCSGHYCHLRLHSRCGGVALCGVGCLAAPLFSAHSMSVALLTAIPVMTTNCVSRHCQMSLGGSVSLLLENTALEEKKHKDFKTVRNCPL